MGRPLLQRIVVANKESLGRLWFSFTEGLRGMRDIQANYQQQRFLGEVADLNERVKITSVREAAFRNAVNTTYSTFYMAMIVCILTYAAWRVADGSLSIGALTTLMLYNGFLSAPLIDFNSFLQIRFNSI